jgi:hypothetical protein
MAAKYSKWPHNVPTFSIPRPSKIYPNGDEDLATLVVTSRGGRANYGKKKRATISSREKKQRENFGEQPSRTIRFFFFL